MKPKREILRYAYFFRELDDRVLDAVAELCGSVSYRGGEFLFQEGEQGDTLYVLLSGEVMMWKH